MSLICKIMECQGCTAKLYNYDCTKIEITMRKAEPMQWASFELPVTKHRKNKKKIKKNESRGNNSYCLFQNS